MRRRIKSLLSILIVILVITFPFSTALSLNDLQVLDDGQSRFLFTGKELDTGSDLYYYGARYYDSFTTRFTQADTNIPNIYDPQDKLSGGRFDEYNIYLKNSRYNNNGLIIANGYNYDYFCPK